MQREEKIETFRALHHGPRILVLPNAWDVASARIYEDAGFAAIATTSAGIAFSLGYPDGQHIPRDEMLEAVGRIAGAVAVPVSADVESGYGDPLRTARGVMQAGAVGLNLEDGHIQFHKQVAHIREVRAATDLVINARTDLFLLGVGEAETRYDRALEHLNGYLDAGADCAFAPGVGDMDTISRLAASMRGPLNILAVAGSPSVKELERAGVARVTVGSGPMRATLAIVRRIAEELRDMGTFDGLRDAIPYSDLNAMLKRS